MIEASSALYNTLLERVRRTTKTQNCPKPLVRYVQLQLTGSTLQVEIGKVEFFPPEDDARPSKGCLDPFVGGVEFAVVASEGVIGWNGQGGAFYIFVELLLGSNAQSLQCQAVGVVERGRLGVMEFAQFSDVNLS